MAGVPWTEMVGVEEEGAAEACWAGKASTGAAPAGRARRQAAMPPWLRPPGRAVVAAALVGVDVCSWKWNAEIRVPGKRVEGGWPLGVGCRRLGRPEIVPACRPAPPVRRKCNGELGLVVWCVDDAMEECQSKKFLTRRRSANALLLAWEEVFLHEQNGADRTKTPIAWPVLVSTLMIRTSRPDQSNALSAGVLWW